MMRRFKNKSVIAAVILCLIVLNWPVSLRGQEVDDLQEDLRSRLERIEELKKKSAIYESSLKQKRKESLTLSNQITIFSDQITKTGLDIEVAQTIIEAANIEIRNLETNIASQEQRLYKYKGELGGLIRWLDREQNRTILQILFTRPSFADFYTELRQLKAVQMSITRLVQEVEILKNQLSQDKLSLEDKLKKLSEELSNLNNQRLSLESQQETKSYLLQQTKSSERQFTALLEAAKLEQEQTSLEITNLEREVRRRLSEEGVSTSGDRPSLIWPVPHERGLSALFYDPDYPFRRVFEHSGVDIRAYQGTAVRAAASGYVARVKSGGAKGYGYIMIIHNGGLATVYGHISKIMTEQDSFVAQGQIIALSGGIPGTPGAGPFSTGPHLHFEIRLEGIPVDPLEYLP